jgi:hypothetical protein
MGAVPVESEPGAAMPTRWARPDALHLQLTVDLGSLVEAVSDEFGWQVWQGALDAIWDVDEKISDLNDVDRTRDGDLLPVPAGATGWEGALPEAKGSELRLRIGRLERWLLSLDGRSQRRRGRRRRVGIRLVRGRRCCVPESARRCGALVGRDEVLSDECYALTGSDYLDRLLVLAEIEILPTTTRVRHRRMRVGVSITASPRPRRLHSARDEGPRRRTCPSSGLAPTVTATATSPPAESAAWDPAQVKIAGYWQTSSDSSHSAPTRTSSSAPRNRPVRLSERPPTPGLDKARAACVWRRERHPR